MLQKKRLPQIPKKEHFIFSKSFISTQIIQPIKADKNFMEKSND